MEDKSRLLQSISSPKFDPYLSNGKYTHMKDNINPEKQPYKSVLTNTDFASKGLYKETTLGLQMAKSQSIFKDAANLRLSGLTFDAVHMNKFIQGSHFGKQGSPTRVIESQTRNKFSPQRLIHANQVRPSHAFSSIDREHKGQQRIYIDQYDGSSSLIKRDEVKTIKEKLGGDAYIYDVEREQALRIDKDFSALKSMLYEDDGGLRSPQQKKTETLAIKEELARYKDFKEKYNLANKRDRQLKNGWRHGVLGVENPDDMGTEVYKDV